MWVFNMKCKYCNKENIIRMPTHQRGCLKYREWFDQTVTKEYLTNEYTILGKSCNEIAQQLGFPSSTSINRAITRYGIEKRNISQSKLQPRCKAKQHETNMKNYGVYHNLCKNHPSRIKWQQRLLDTEGITNVFQREAVKVKIAEAIRRGEVSKHGSRISGIHRKVYSWLISVDVDCTNEYNVPNTRFWYDIKINGTNKIIEVNGDLYHANPLIYKSSDIIEGPKHWKPTTAQSIWIRDEIKNGAATNEGYELLIVWERDIRKEFERVTTEILNFIGKSNETSST